MKKIVLFKETDPGTLNVSDMSYTRRERYALLAGEKEKHNFLSAENLTLQFLKSEFSILSPVIEGSTGTKPYIAGNSINFSRSYADDYLVIGADDTGKIGIDAEKIQVADADLIKFFFTKEEQSYVKTSPDANLAFTLIWTRKESCMKCNGEGLKFSFDIFNTAPEKYISNTGKLSDNNQNTGNFFINSYYVENTVISVCSTVDDVFPQIIVRG